MTGLYNVRNYTTFGEMDPNAVTFGQLLKSAGYATCIAGKWQLGRDINLPRKFGFDEHCLWQHLRRPPRYANPGLEINGVEKNYSGGSYGPDVVNDYVLDFIDRHKDRPFFLYYPMMLTHAPFQPTPDSPDWDPKAEGESVNQAPRHFGEMTNFMDKLVGKVVARLEQHKLRERTLVLFVGDNGTGKNHRSKMGSRVVVGGKGTTTPEGMHVPLIANWPGTIAPHVSADLIDSTDFLPTVCEVAGITPQRIDGRSFLPQLRSERGNPRDWCYCWYSPRRETPDEFTFDAHYRLNRDGSFRRFEKNAKPLDRGTLDAQEQAALQKLEAGLLLFKNARPAGLDQTPRNKTRRGRAQDE
jgi:arylsulfatase A